MRFVLAMLALTSSVVHSPNAHAKGRTAMEQPRPTMTYTLTYAAGPLWKRGLPPDQQELGPHMGWVKQLFDSRRLVANGHLADGHGFYVFAVESAAEIAKIASSDPGIDSGVVQVEAAAPWALMFDNLAADVGKKELFVINYRPGRKWQPKKTLMGQDLAAHMGYVQRAFADGTLLAGGPVDDHQGRYIVAAANQAAVERWVNADPAVTSEVLHPETIAWQAFNRQSAYH
jgi:uncharacterized protein YciI